METGRINQLFLRVKSLFCRRQLDRDLDDELQFHLAMREKQLSETGMPSDEARYSARRNLGNPTRTKESARDLWTFTSLESWWQDLRFAARMLRKNPGFAAVAVLTLALAIGANTAIFSVVRAVIFRPLPFPGADRLAVVLVSNRDIPFRTSAHLGDLVNWQAHSRTFQSLAGVTPYGGGVLTGEREPESIFTETVTWEFFRVLGVPPERGRVLTADDDRSGAPQVAVISHEFWQRHYGGDEGILHLQVTLNLKEYSVARTNAYVETAPQRLVGAISDMRELDRTLGYRVVLEIQAPKNSN